MGKVRTMVERLEERRGRHARRSIGYRIGFAALAFIVLLAGVVLSLPLVPGPGLPLVGIGLAMLALEFAWADRLLRRIAHRIDQIEETVGLTGLLALLAVAVGAVVVALLIDVPYAPF